MVSTMPSLNVILAHSQLLLFHIDVKDPRDDKAENIVEQVNRMKMMNSQLMQVPVGCISRNRHFRKAKAE
jgi:hypothetical protein